MVKICYQVNDYAGEIVWAANEHFDELAGKTFALGKMEATQIEQMTNLSLTAKLLLSAVAGAIIQHLLDKGILATDIFQTGTFRVLT